MVGIGFGATPGINGIMACALFIPLTFFMEPAQALLLLSGIYVGSIYGGSISAILFNIPGDPAAMCTTFDGYPLTLKGQADKALGTAIICSAIGGFFSTIVLLFAAPQIANWAVKFGPPEYFAFSLLGLSVITSLDTKNIQNSIISALVGVIIGMIGLSDITANSRFTFGNDFLQASFAYLPVMIGVFALGEVLSSLENFRDQQLIFTGKVSSLSLVQGVKLFQADHHHIYGNRYVHWFHTGRRCDGGNLHSLRDCQTEIQKS